MNTLAHQLARIAALVLFVSLVVRDPLAARDRPPVPDFTRGDSIPAGADHDWNLGPTGARGWIYSFKLVTTNARQIRITKVDKGSPADGVLVVGDVILGAGGKPFSFDPRTELGRAITEAETDARDGDLRLIRWRAGKTETVLVKLPVLGTYSETAPYGCEKSERILERGCAALAARMNTPAYRPNPITRSLNALALLASGDPIYLSLVEREARWAADFSTRGFKTWYYGYVITFLSEYTLATGDDSVMPGLRRLALDAAHGQSRAGSWGHRFALSDGRLGGYGMMNSPGIPLTISLVLARKAGVRDPAVARAIERSARLLSFYIGKGAVPYGDHAPWIQTHEDNGKCGMASVLFNLLGHARGAEFFSRMSVASHGAERDTGHTGNFFNMLWAMPGVALSGPDASGAWMREFGSWYFDLARGWDGSFTHQGPPGPRNDSYRGWDCTGAYLLAYAMSLEKLYLTGKQRSLAPRLDRTGALSLIRDGRGWTNQDRNSAYDKLSVEQLLERLSSWSPVVRERAAMALGRRRDRVTGRLIPLLDSRDLHTRYGACQALKMQRGHGAPAISALIKTLRSDDLWLRALAGEALAGIGTPAREAVPEMLARITRNDPRNDPRGMEQRYFSFSLFNRRGGLIGRSLEGVDRELLVEAVRVGLLNEDGRARGSYASVFKNLTFEELAPLLPAIHRAIVEPAPSGIMFADAIRMSGLQLFAEHRISEGVELLADYARNQKKHGSEKRIVKVMKMLQSYGAHGKRVIPQLERVARYFEKEEEGFPRRLSLAKAKVVRETIQAIETSTEMPELIHLRR